MSRLSDALRSVVREMSGGDLAMALAVPKRTADRWLAELRGEDDLSNWPGDAIEAIAAFEARTWGTRRIVDALLPAAHTSAPPPADARSVAASMSHLIESHACNAELLAAMAADVADGVLDQHEARRLLPLVEKALVAVNGKHRALGELRISLERRLKEMR